MGAKKRYGRALWDELCELVRVDDGLPTFVSNGMWTAEKLYFICEYLDLTTRGLKTRRNKFPDGLCYIDLFCGTGVSCVRLEGGGNRRFPGSPLIASAVPNTFDKLVLVDRDPAAITAVKARVSQAGYKGELVTLEADCNTHIDAIAQHVPLGSLNIAFIDPFSLDIHFESIATLASRRALDLIILFSDRFDLGRNVHKYYYPSEEESKLDRFLGTSTWRTRYERSNDLTGQNIRSLFADIYREQLASLGYHYSQSWPLNGPRGPAFRLVYASKHPLGLRFCEIALKADLAGNQNLFGE